MPYTLIAKGLMVLGILIAIGVGVKYVDNRLEHHYGDPIRAAWKASDEKRIAFQTALVLSMSKKITDLMSESAERERKRNAQFAELESRARRLVVGRIVTVSSNASGLFDDTARAANAARSDARAETGTNSLSVTSEAHYDEQELTLWIVQAGKAYADAYGLWKDCRQREDTIREALAKGANP